MKPIDLCRAIAFLILNSVCLSGRISNNFDNAYFDNVEWGLKSEKLIVERKNIGLINLNLRRKFIYLADEYGKILGCRFFMFEQC
jgi:hypothetical protein